MIISIPELETFPSEPIKNYIFYHIGNDNVYIQLLDILDVDYPLYEILEDGKAVRDIYRAEDRLTTTRYGAKDYKTFYDEIVAEIKSKWGDRFDDIMAADPAIMIASYVSAALDQMSWMLDREADEHYLETARIRSNVARLARYLSYKDRPAVAGSVDVSVSLPNGPYIFDVPIIKGHQFEGPSSLIFECSSEQIIPAGNTTKIVPTYQGETFKDVFRSDGTAKQKFTLSHVGNGKFLAFDSVKVFVGIVEWYEEDFLSYGLSNRFEVIYNTVPPSIVFGDGVVGTIPTQGLEITVTYVVSSGKLANKVISGEINKSKSKIIINFDLIPITVNNQFPVTGSFDAETLDEVKAKAPRAFMAAERVVTREDYIALVNAFRSISGAVAKSNAMTIRGVAQDLQLRGLFDDLYDNPARIESNILDIIQLQNDIILLVGSSSVVDSIAGYSRNVSDTNSLITSEMVKISDAVSSVNSYLGVATSGLDVVKSKLSVLPYQENIGIGDSVTKSFGKQLQRFPISKNSLFVVVQDSAPELSGTNGDCDSVPGRLSVTLYSSTIPGPQIFKSSDIGKNISIGGEIRRISRYIDTDTIEYSGSRIYGTDLIVYLYRTAFSGYDDGSGKIIGNGITGTVSYDNGYLDISLSSAPDGVSGRFGDVIVVSYQYENISIKNDVDSVVSNMILASDSTSEFYSIKDNTDSFILESNDYLSKLNTVSGSIVSKANESISKSGDMMIIPIQMNQDIDAVYAYLDSVISGPCKANIVRVSILTVDENGFYVSPSLSLIADVKAYLDSKSIQTVFNSVVSGDYDLIKVSIEVLIKVNKPYTFKMVSGKAEVLIDDILKNRDYGVSLFRKELYDQFSGSIEIDYCNIRITGVEYANSANTTPVPIVDSDGNLFIQQFETITKGTISIIEIKD